MAYSEIINEIQEQIDDINAQIIAVNEDIATKLLEIEELEAKLPQFDSQIQGIEQLQVNAQALIDSAGDHNINLNINVTATGSGGSNDGNVVITTPTEM